MAHKDIEQINLLIHLLDNRLFDLFLHLDKKSKLTYSDIEKPVKVCQI